MTRVAGQTVGMSETGTMLGGRLRERTAEEIRVLLARRRISAAELARRTGMKQSTLARRMTGEIAFDLDDLEAISEALGVPVTALMPATFRPNDRSGVSPVQATPTPRTAATRPKGRPANASTRPQSSGPPTRRRPARIDRTGTR